MAEAHEDEVLKAWEGLGYYSRARNLHSAVKEVKRAIWRQGTGYTEGNWKNSKELVLIRRGAILSIAYGIPEPAVDGNVMRVMSRILSIWDDIAKPKKQDNCLRISSAK
ncbi:hypothetical protein GCM10020331_089180 [Ectobacillus funiculus]